MRIKLIWSFLSVTALAVSGFIAGCDSDAKIARSAEGESCARTSDCDDGLRCKEMVCVSSGSDTNNAGGDGNAAGAGNGGPKPPTLGGPGETCGKRTDCQDGLACISQRCTADMAMGEGGGGNSGPTLGAIGETCGLTSDCQAGLQCLPTITDPRVEALTTGVGVCQPTDNGLEPTGKACGAECLTDADCCELPYELHAPLSASSCTQIDTLLTGVNCAMVTAGTTNAALCFAQTTYCDCAKKTWSCDTGRCTYIAACTKAKGVNAPGGCPTYTRSGIPLTATCDATAETCTALTTTCAVDADCLGKAATVAPGQAVQQALCAKDECVCRKETGSCYRACQEDLDCPAAFSCDVKKKVCVADPACESDAECVVRMNDIRAKCTADKTCDLGCNNDRDCNGGNLTSGSYTRVCNADHVCQELGCSSDRDCSPTVNGLRLFCTDKVAVAGSAALTSAVTD